MRRSASTTAPSGCASPPNAICARRGTASTSPRCGCGRRCCAPISPAPTPASIETETRLTPRRWRGRSRRRHDALDNFAGRLATHSERHESLLARGYVVVRDGDARVVTEAASVRPGAALDLEFYDGKVGAIAGRTPRRPIRRAPPRPEQGSLF